jgi:acetyl esterase/lipase
MKATIVCIEALLAMLVAAAWLKASKLWQWQLALLAQEFGHWFAVVAIVLAVAAWFVFTGWRQLAMISAGLLLAAYLAAQRTPEFNWTRLWLPWFYSPRNAPSERHVFWQEGSESLDVVLYRAHRTGPTPWLLVLHSGGWDGGSADEFADAHRELNSRGITVLAMNYRLAPQHPWPAQRDDVQRAVAWARAHAGELGIAPDQLFLMGRSAGGQIASACAYSMPELQARGVILLYSPMDMIFARKYAYTEDILNSLQLLRQYLGGDPEQAPDNYRTASAIDFITPRSPPALLMHSERDSLVWVEQSRRFSKRLTDAGVPHRFMELPCSSHGFDYFPSTPGGQMAVQAVVRFVANRP